MTLLKITDPAQGADQYTTADAGKRFVAASLKIMNSGTSSYQDDANNNITLIGSDNQSYTFDSSTVSGCTNFSNGQYTLAAGESATGCVVFQVPNGVQPQRFNSRLIAACLATLASGQYNSHAFSSVLVEAKAIIMRLVRAEAYLILSQDLPNSYAGRYLTFCKSSLPHPVQCPA